MFGRRKLTNDRTGKLTRADSVFNNTMEAIGIGEEFKERLLLSRWPDIVGKPGYNHIFIVALKDNILYLTTDNPVWADEFNFMKDDVINKMNSIAGSHVVSTVRFVKKPYKKIRPYMQTDFRGYKDDVYYDFSPEMKDAVLTEEDMEKVNSFCENVEDTALREAMSKAYTARIKLNKLKKEKGFHPCPICHALTEPAEDLCTECRRQKDIKKYRRMRKIIEDEPWITYAEMNKRIPCEPEIFIHQWAALVQNLIFQVDVNDLENPKTKTLAMVYHRCTPDQVAKNDHMVEKALKDLRNDIGEAYYDMVRSRKKEKIQKKEEERKHRYDRPKKKQ